MAYTLSPESTAVLSDISCESDLQLELETCWLCLNGTATDDRKHEQLVAQCKCPRKCHPSCLATWQLHSAGTEEEHVCRFCKTPLPDWKGVLLPTPSKQGSQEHAPDAKAYPKITTLICVVHKGKKHFVRVWAGQGQQAFVQQLQAITGMSESEIQALNLTFNTTAPHTAQPLTLRGLSAFDAAAHCAAASTERATGGSSSSGSHNTGGSSLNPLRAWWKSVTRK